MESSDKMYKHGGELTQVMPYTEGFIDIETGVITGRSLIFCKSDGDISLEFDTETVKATSMVEGETRSLVGVKAVTITTGKYDFL